MKRFLSIMIGVSILMFSASSVFGQCPEKMAYIPKGFFMAGKVTDLHEMWIDVFCIDKYEVTQANYEKVMANNPSYFKKGPNYPVEQVTWFEAKQYCDKVGKRLPTEWEWEKAAKAGTLTKYYWGNSMESGYANICDINCQFDWKNTEINDGYKTTAPVGSFIANPLGLYDMLGNVFEWTLSSCIKIFKVQQPARVLRGGSWTDRSYNAQTSYRGRADPSGRGYFFGFRCAQ